jgi:hypothetical protein
MIETTEEIPYLATFSGVSTVNPSPITGIWKVWGNIISEIILFGSSAIKAAFYERAILPVHRNKEADK